MRLSYRWLRELTGVDWSAKEIGERLTLCGTACEQIESVGRFLDRVVVGQVTGLRPVEGASKIKLATVELGGTSLDVICGAPNVAVGQKVAVAQEGARLAGDMVIKKVKIRGVESTAMICSERELGISDDHSGIIVLEANAKPGMPLIEALELDDYVMTFELTPNRGDSMSAIGIARDIAALAEVPLKKPKIELKDSSDEASDYIKVSIDDPIGCPRYAARIIRNVKIGPSPWWLKKKLLMSGIRPISNIVDITNLVMLETGQPLHAFDLDRFGSNEVVVRRAREKERFTTLDGNAHELTSQVLLITNGKTGVAAGGIMGGLDSEIEASTTTILLEAAYFNPAVIRRGRKELGLVTESSSRFEKGADPNGIPFAIDRAAALMRQLAGGEVLKGIVDCYPQKIEPKKIVLRPSRCHHILGTEFPVDTIKKILSGLEFEVSGEQPLQVKVPTFRPDIEREIDVIEEIARMAGYDSIPDSIENIGPLFTPAHYSDKFKSEAKHILAAAGFDEIVNHGLADGRFSGWLHPEMTQVRILNPVSEDLSVMRNSLVQTTLNVLGHNIAYRNLDLRFFEIGKAYLPVDGGTIEDERLSLAVSGQTEHTWRDRSRPYDFYDLSGVITRLAEHFQWGSLDFIPQPLNYLDEELSFKIICRETLLGFIGKVAAHVTDKLDIKQDVYIAELTLESLMTLSGGPAAFEPLPVYPAAPRDLAIVVDEGIKTSELVAAITSVGGELAEKVEIFDLYRGKQIEAGKKSIAVAIIYRSKEGNLSSEQVDERQQAVISRLIRDFKAQIRDK